MLRFVKSICIFLVLVMLVAAFAACDDKGKGGLQVTTTTTITTTPTGTGDVPEVVSKLGIIPESVSYGGDAYNLLLWSNAKYRLWPESMSDGETILNDLYLRNQMIAEELDAVLDVTYRDASSGENGDALFNEALEGTTSYEAICSYSLYPPKLALEGVLVDLYSLEYPDTRMEWYPSDLCNWEVRNRLFFLVDNSAVQNILANFVVYANRTMIEDKGLENIEQIVIDGNWTLDVLKTYSRNWEAEAQNNDTKVEADRVYGFTLANRTCMEAFYHGAGFRVYSHDENGDPQWEFLNPSEIEKTSSMLDKLMDIMNSSEFGAGPNKGFGNYNTPLELKNSAFHLSCLDQYNLMGEDGTYVVIPAPKLNEEQDRYYSSTNSCLDMWCVPKKATDSEIGGMIIEASAYNDYEEIAPKFWDMDFKYRYSSSENGVKIFDLIRSSYVVEFGRVWLTLGTPYDELNRCISTNQETLILQNTYAGRILGLKADTNANLKALKKLMNAMDTEDAG